MVLGAFLVVSTTAATKKASDLDAVSATAANEDTDTHPVEAKRRAGATSLLFQQHEEEAPETEEGPPGLIDRLETAGLLAGITLTTGGAMWAAERLSEAMKNTVQNEPDQITLDYTAAFSGMLFVGMFLLTFYILRRLKVDTVTQALLATIAGASGGFFGLGFHCLSGQMSNGTFEINTESMLCFGFSVFFFLAVGAIILYHIYQKMGGKKADIQLIGNKAMLHGVGFLALVGGSTQFAFTFGENMQDRRPLGDDTPLGFGEVDNMGWEALSVWILWSVGFFWLIKTFVMKPDAADAARAGGLGEIAFVGLTAAATAGLMVGGFELIVAYDSVVMTGLGSALISCAGLLIIFVMLLKIPFFKNLVTCGGQGEVGRWLGNHL